MLLQFSVTNHRSIKDTAIISMKAAADKTMKEILISPDGKKELVPVMAIYGANAAGKSNIIHALELVENKIGASDEETCAGIEQIVVFKDGRIEIRMRD